MRVEDMILVSIDDHVIEPQNMFEKHVPARHLDQAPKSIMDENGFEKWWFQRVYSGSTSLKAAVGWPYEEWELNPSTFAETRPGTHDVDERVRDMNRNGILASMCFPSFTGFSGRFFQEAKDKDLSLIMLKAYNDWHIDEWAASHPGRFIPLALAPVWDTKAMVDEIKRVAAKGCRAIAMPELPHLQGLPSYHDMDDWGPVLQAAAEEQVLWCLHIGLGFAAINSAPGAPIGNFIILATQVSTFAAQDLLSGGAFMNYPDLKVAWSEAGIGWIPFCLDRRDRHLTNQRWLDNDFGGKLPSEVFRERSIACYVTDPTTLRVRNQIGIDIIAWECDYPHSDSIFPDAPEFVHAELERMRAPRTRRSTRSPIRTPAGTSAGSRSNTSRKIAPRSVPCVRYLPTWTPRSDPSTNGASSMRPAIPAKSSPPRCQRGRASSISCPVPAWERQAAEPVASRAKPH